MAANYFEVKSLLRHEGRVVGVRAQDREGRTEHEVLSRVVVNATGVFADDIRRMDEPGTSSVISPSQGVHLVLPEDFLKSEDAVIVPRTDDGRVLFAVPWHGRVVVGTTDTPVPEVSLEPRPLEEEVEFLLGHCSRYLSMAPLPDDVLSVFAGLRPLVSQTGARTTASVSRDHALFVSASGLVTITGGKWTTYRSMAEDAVDRAAEVAGLAATSSVTRRLPLHGWSDSPAFETSWQGYGADAVTLDRWTRQDPSLQKKIHSRLPYSLVEVVWAVREEMARTVEDVLGRRTRALFLDAAAAVEAAPGVAALMARELGRESAWERQQVLEFGELAAGYRL
jgi:glycerol-3-phosphate dehydrogenase